MGYPPLLIGVPCHHRQWCLDEWFDSLEAQDVPERTQLVFMLSDPSDPSLQVIFRRWEKWQARIELADGLPSFEEHEKHAPGRYAVLAEIRNRLLRIAAAQSPAYYLSWDTDIILEPGSIRAMIETSRSGPAPLISAVGALTDMGGEVYPGHPSMMALDGTDARRYDDLSVGQLVLEQRPQQVGVVMGCVLMSPGAYRNARYADHILGEDVGWAIQCEAMGIERWICPKARGRHLYRLSAPNVTAR